jgi:molecular chaperone GrpE
MSEVQDVTAEWYVNECLEQLKRERADFLNYKHRVDRERARDRERERLELLRDLVPAIDDLSRALDHTPADLAEHPWAQGIALARERFLDALRQVGVEPVGTAGERFEPSIHEAVMYQEQPSASDQHVESVLRPGYRVGPQLLRPAQVVVVGPPRGKTTRRHSDDGQGHRHRSRNDKLGHGDSGGG